MNHTISYFYWAAAKWLPWGFASQKNLSLLFKSQGGTFLLLLAQYHKINVRFIDLLGWKVWYAKCTCISRKKNLLSWKQYIKLLASIPSRYWLNSSIREDQIDLYFISRSVLFTKQYFYYYLIAFQWFVLLLLLPSPTITIGKSVRSKIHSLVKLFYDIACFLTWIAQSELTW